MYVLWRIIVKELQQLRRDRRMIPVIFVAPVVQILLFGYAVNQDVTDVPVLLVDQDHTAASRELANRFFGSPSFELAGSEQSVDAIEPWLVDGRAQLALVVGAGYGAAVATGRTPEVQVIADGSDSSSAVVGLSYASRIVGGESRELVERRLAALVAAAARAGAGGREGVGGAPPAARPAVGARPGRIVAEPRVWYNPDLKSRWFYVPAVLAMVLMVMTMMLAAMGVVREKEIGTMEQIIVTPIRPWQLIVGKLFPYAVIGVVDTVLISAVTVLWFEVPLVGSFALLVGLTLLFLASTLGLGLLASTMVRTQQQAMMTTAFLMMVPMLYLSGLIFPIENMPSAIQLVTRAIPLRYYAVVLRGIFLKGAGIAVLWPEAATLAAMGVAILALAAARFRKRLD